MNTDDLGLQRAFTALLRSPVLVRHRSPELYALVRSSARRPTLTEWFASRLGYRLVITDTAARLFRAPLVGTVVAPARLPGASRRVPVLALLAAVSAESAEDLTSTQDLSDRVRLLAGRPDVELAPYDPDRFAERQLFVAALQLLTELGALHPVGRDMQEQGEGWAHRRNSVGNAYRVDRSLLLRLVEPAAADAVLGRAGESGLESEHLHRFGVMRRLVELPVCLVEDLTPGERTYLMSQRSRIVGWCTEMTGWIVEQRAEGLALIAAEESDTDIPFPRLRATDFATLMLLDQLHDRADDDRHLTEHDVLIAAAEVRARHPRAMTKDLDSDGAVRDQALELLTALDLLRAGGRPGQWWLSPAAARYRSPVVVAATRRIDEETG